MKMYSNIRKFAESAPDLAKTFEDYFNHRMAVERSSNLKFASLPYTKERSLEEKETAINKMFVEEVEKRSRYEMKDFASIESYATNATVKSFADDIINSLVDMVLPQAVIGSIGQICEFRFGGFNDTFKFDIENNALFSVSEAGRRQRFTPAQRLENTTVTLTPINHQITVTASLPNIMAGRDSIAKHMMKAVKTIETQMLYDAYDTFVSATESLASPLMVASYKEEDLIKLCQTVTAWNQNRKAVILGTAIALKKVLPDSTNARILLQDDYVTLGHIRTFNDFDVIEMPQVADYSSDAYGLKLRDDRLYVISPSGDKLIKGAVGNDSITHTSGTFDFANMTQKSTTNKAWQMGCITNQIAGVVKLA